MKPGLCAAGARYTLAAPVSDGAAHSAAVADAGVLGLALVMPARIDWCHAVRCLLGCGEQRLCRLQEGEEGWVRQEGQEQVCNATLPGERSFSCNTSAQQQQQQEQQHEPCMRAPATTLSTCASAAVRSAPPRPLLLLGGVPRERAARASCCASGVRASVACVQVAGVGAGAMAPERGRLKPRAVSGTPSMGEKLGVGAGAAAAVAARRGGRGRDRSSGTPSTGVQPPLPPRLREALPPGV